MSDPERLNRALDRLAAGQSPRAEVGGLTGEEEAMVRMAQMLRGSAEEGPRPEFTSRLRERIAPGPRVSRRTAFGTGLGALAAGLVAGLGLDRWLGGKPSSEPAAAGWKTVVERGTWHQVAAVTDVPEGAVVRFTAGAVRGFVVNHRGEYRAYSGICTHLGCTLNFSRQEQSFVCPCHGAEFDMLGQMRYGPGGYGQVDLPPLPWVKVRVREQHIEVLGT